MKNLYLIIFLFIGVAASAQSPDKMSYQAVLRDANGEILKNQDVSIQFSVLQTSISGTSVYQEDHKLTTNSNGLVSVYMGTGTVSSGDFSAIDWSDGTYFLQTDIDPTGGSNYVIKSTTELVSVPYALHANVADSLIGGVNETDPVFDASVAKGITTNNTTYWNNKLDSSSIQNFVDLTTNQTVGGEKEFSSDVTLANGNSLRWTSDDVRIEATTASDNMKFYVGNTEILKLEQANLAATFAGDLTVNGITVGKGGGAVATNTANGRDALSNNTIGSFNTANGNGALLNNTTGNGNTANGYHTLMSNTTGLRNTAIGAYALRNNTKGSNNTANGNGALFSNTTGVANTAIGYLSLYSNNTGNANTANGFEALKNNTTDTNNTAIGAYALRNNTKGSNNTANGAYALQNNIEGLRNTAIGAYALSNNTKGSFNTANGNGALSNNTKGSFNTANGAYALENNTEGNHNSANSNYALNKNTIGNDNTAIGSQSLYANTGGRDNTAIGKNALYNNISGFYNTATGKEALFSNTTGGSNTANGYWALKSNKSSGNTANGYWALADNSSGSYNAANGYWALVKNTTGSYNTANGYSALYKNTAGNDNTAIGRMALYTLISGNNNTAIGRSADVSSSFFSNTTAIGYGATVTASQRVVIGNYQVLRIGGNVGWTNLSDGRIKENVQEAVPGLSFISELRPVTYTLNTKKQDEITMQAMPDSIKEKRMLSDADYLESSSIVRTGFIAQEVEAAAEKVGFDFDGVSAPENETDLYGIRYAEFVVPLVKAMQEQQEMIDGQQATIELLLKRIEALEKE